MQLILSDAHVYEKGKFIAQDLTLNVSSQHGNDRVALHSVFVLPGLIDVHVHFREPGFCYKETIATGSRAAARGGYCAVCTMPNLSPVPDASQTLRPQLEAIATSAVVRVLPYGAISVGEKGATLSDMEALAPYVCAFSDDGRGVQSWELMRAAMQKAKALHKIICAHCEDNTLLRGGYIHDGAYARAHGHKGISSESEWRQLARDLELARETGCSYHACHISTKESVSLIREAKKAGLDVSCETAPHYLLLTENDLREDGRYKMNPPLRTQADREALLEGLLDGTVDMIATDHAPHTMEEKSRGLAGSLMGVVGLETALPVLYTHLVRTGFCALEDLVQWMCIRPAQRFLIDLDPQKNYTVYDFDTHYTIDPESFQSMGRSTPFAGDTVYGKNLLTVCGGAIAYLHQ